MKHVLFTKIKFLGLLAVFFCAMSWAHLADAKVGKATGLPIPRFVSLASDEVNMRHGPGKSFPIAWVYRVENLPVQVIDEWVHWRKIRDLDNIEGWVHKSLLRSSRSAIITNDLADVLDQETGDTKLVGQIGRNVVVAIKACGIQHCLIEKGPVEGWLSKSQFYGAFGEEMFGN